MRGPLTKVDLDPDGRLPLWNSGSAAMQGAGVRALIQAGWGERAEVLSAQALARASDDPLTRAALVEYLAVRERYSDIVKVTEGLASTCDTRATCRMLAHRALALVETGDMVRARDLIERLRPVAERNAARRLLNAAASRSGIPPLN